MTKRWTVSSLLLILIAGLLVRAGAALETGKTAPLFSGKGSDGKEYRLADLKGKFVVLQWYNRDCPFSRKHYDSRNMQTLQEKYGQKGVVWFEMISSAEGKQGYLTALDAQANRMKEGSKAAATLLDPNGKIASLYAAKTTPHMFIIDP